MRYLFIPITLVFLIINGCSKEDIKDDVVPNTPTIPNDTLIFECKPLSISLNFTQTGNIDLREWTFNSKGLETGYKHYNGGILQLEHINYKYDKYGNTKYVEAFKDDTLIYIINSTFRSYDKKLTTIKENPRTGFTELQEWTYNAKGYETGYKLFYDGLIDREYKNYQHDEFGNAIYYETYLKGNLYSKSTSTFLSYNKRLKKTTEYVLNIETNIWEWTYNSEGIEIGLKSYFNGVLTGENKNYQHDEFGNVTYVEPYSNGFLHRTETSTYNCIEKKVSK